MKYITDDREIVICGGGAKPTDSHFTSTIHCVDEEIIKWLERLERCRKHQNSATENLS